MEEHAHNFFASKASIVGLFAVLSAALTIPVIVLVAQQPQTLRGNASGPENNRQLATSPIPQKETMIAGYVYHDQNQDGKRDNEENPFPGVDITITEIKKTTQTSTVTQLKADNFGYFKYTFFDTTPSETDYVVKVVLPDDYKTITTNPVLFTNFQKGTTEIIEFGLYSLKPTVVSATPIPLNKNDFLTGD